MHRLAFALAVVLAPLAASASKPKCRLERIDASSLGDNLLRFYASVVELEGNVVEHLNTAQFTLRVDGKSKGRPERIQPFSAAREEVDVAFVVETAAQYKKVLEPVKEALKEFVSDQPPTFKAMLISFGSEFEAQTRFAPAAALADPIDDLTTDEDSIDLKMVEAVRLAMMELKKLDRPDKPAPRRMIVLISDGLNVKMDRGTMKQLGLDAAKARIPIHTIAFSPGDERGPLLNLGEISKRSNGTFRWAQAAGDLKGQLATLADEVRKQYVLTFKAPVGETAGHRFQLVCEELPSNVLDGSGLFTNEKQEAAAKGGVWARMGAWRWVLAGVLGLLLLLWLIGVFLQRQSAAPKAPKKKIEKPAPGPAAQQAKAAAGGAHVVNAPAAQSQGTSCTLIGIGGALGGTRFGVHGTVTLGKAAGLTITIADDPTVSSRHCEIANDGKGFVLKDLGSTNGSFVNSTKVSGAHRLSDGDIVRLGANTQFKIRID